jgi:starch synthase
VKVVFCSSEIAPFASTGGLGEVARSLPAALHRLGLDVWRVMPMYRQVMEGGHRLHDTGLRLKIPIGFRVHTAEVWIHQEGDAATYFIRRDEYFDRRELYALPERDYTDNFERFVFFQKAVVSLIDALGFAPDIVHGNDWISGLIPLYLRHGTSGVGRTGREVPVFTVHNLAYQGIYPGTEFAQTNLPFSCFSIEGVEFFGNINCLKAGLTSSAVSTTVSRSYADEIRTSEGGCGLDGVLRSLKDRLVGIQNGVDDEIWNPARDPLIKFPYDAANPAGKTGCKSALLARSGFARALEIPLVGMISRLVDQKGFDLLAQAMPALMEMPLKIVLLGSGQEKYQTLCTEWARRWPDRFSATLGFDHKLAHRIESGSDMFLMPSRSEPCGLSQLYALKYGTIPIVHATGGLKDTVHEAGPDGASGNGFRFERYAVPEMLAAVRRALDLYARPEAWSSLRRRAMEEDHSWRSVATDYIALYERARAHAGPVNNRT